MGMNDINSLSHTKWNCKYHIVFCPKFRRHVFYQQKKEAVGRILRQLCEWKDVEIIEAEVCPDHIHMLISIPPKFAVSSFMGYLKGKSATMLYEQFAELKYKYRNREFWCRGYYVDTVGKNTQRIAEYVRNQLKADKLGEQLTLGDVRYQAKRKQLAYSAADGLTYALLTRIAKNKRAMLAQEKPPARPVDGY